jgi:hypothetical protein
MNRLIAIAICLPLLAGLAIGQCQNAAMRGVLIHCEECSGVVMIDVCSGGTGKCDGFRFPKNCGFGGCGVVGAGACLSAAPTRALSSSLQPILTDAPSFTLRTKCSGNQEESLENWVSQHRPR